MVHEFVVFLNLYFLVEGLGLILVIKQRPKTKNNCEIKRGSNFNFNFFKNTPKNSNARNEG